MTMAAIFMFLFSLSEFFSYLRVFFSTLKTRITEEGKYGLLNFIFLKTKKEIFYLMRKCAIISYKVTKYGAL